MAKKVSAKQSVLGIDKQWQAESDLRTLTEAVTIKKDKARMAAAQKLAKDRLMELAGIASDEDGDAD